VASLGRWLKRYERPTDRAAIISFTAGATQSAIVPASGLAGDPRGMAPGPAGGGTAFVPVVRAAQEVFSRSGGAYYNVLILVTDGDAGDSAQAIAQLPIVANRVFIVALDRGGAWDHARERWERAGFPVTTVGNRAPNEIGAALARAVMQAAGQHT
jgi:hypothetical protein